MILGFQELHLCFKLSSFYPFQFKVLLVNLSSIILIPYQCKIKQQNRYTDHYCNYIISKVIRQTQ